MYGKNINSELLKNVEQPKMAKTLIKLREVYVEFMAEMERANAEYGVFPKGTQEDKFITYYNAMTAIISSSMARIMDSEINEAIG